MMPLPAQVSVCWVGPDGPNASAAALLASGARVTTHRLLATAANSMRSTTASVVVMSLTEASIPSAWIARLVARMRPGVRALALINDNAHRTAALRCGATDAVLATIDDAELARRLQLLYEEAFLSAAAAALPAAARLGS